MELRAILKPTNETEGVLDRTTKIVSLPIGCIKSNPNQPRRTFTDSALAELSQSILNFGVMQPITVRKVGPNFFELIAGERRLRASKMAGLTHIPAIVVDVDNENSAMLALLENLQREDLNYMEEADGYARLIGTHHMTQEELADKLGKKQSTIANKLRLLKLSPIVRDALLSTGLSERHARALLRLENEVQTLEVLHAVVEKHLNVKETEAYIDQYLQKGATEKEGTKKKRVYQCKDIRIFTNTIKQAVDMMLSAGIQAKASSKDCGDHLEYTIIIPK